MSTIELETTAREYREIQAEIKTLQEQADALKHIMICEMDSQCVEKLQAGAFEIRYTLVESGRLDSTKLRAEQPEIYMAYVKNAVSTRFQVA